MSMVDPEGLATLEDHMAFVAGVKAAVRKARGKLPDPSTVSPTILGAKPLDFAMPPMMERAFGYRGDLRFVEFSYSPRTRRFGYSDGGDHILSDEDLWTWFLHHPLVAYEVDEARYPTLYGTFLTQHLADLEDVAALTEQEGQTYSEPCHCLLLDREDRQPYLFTTDQLNLFFPLAEPEGSDHHTVFVDGLLLSPGSEEYRTRPPIELAEQLRVFMDDQFEFMEGRANWPTGGSRHSRS